MFRHSELTSAFKVDNMLTMLAMWIFMLSSVHVTGALTEYSFREGENADLRCPFHFSEYIDVKVQIDDRPPFFRNGILDETGLSESQREDIGRFDIRFVETKHQPDQNFELQTIIKNISRDDAGLYSCKVYNRDQLQSEMSKSFEVHVEYPPGRASCNFTKLEHHEELIDKRTETFGKLLQCTASSGSHHQTYITCYQNHELIPFVAPSRNGPTVFTRIWIEPDTPVHCCSLSRVHVHKRNICDCDDFVWFPPNQFKGDTNFSPCSEKGEYKRADPTEVNIVGEEESGAVECELNTVDTICMQTITFCLTLALPVFFVFSMNVMVIVFLWHYKQKKYKKFSEKMTKEKVQKSSQTETLRSSEMSVIESEPASKETVRKRSAGQPSFNERHMEYIKGDNYGGRSMR